MNVIRQTKTEKSRERYFIHPCTCFIFSLTEYDICLNACIKGECVAVGNDDKGECAAVGNDYKCICPPGYTGIHSNQAFQ